MYGSSLDPRIELHTIFGGRVVIGPEDQSLGPDGGTLSVNLNSKWG